MSSETHDPSQSPLRDVAQNPEATARYLAEIQRTLLDIGRGLETLETETRVHLRSTHVEGDRWYHARLRARPVENELKKVMKNLNKLTEGLENAAYKRHAHEDVVAHTEKERKAKELERTQTLPPSPQPVQDASRQASHEREDNSQNYGYDGPRSLYDLRGRNSA